MHIALIVVFLALGSGQAGAVAPVLAIVVSWYCSEAFGMILTGTATDFNSGLLVVVMALAVWPKVQALQMSARARVAREL